MKLKEHPDIIFDSIPKLYERSTRVFITHLDGLEADLRNPPREFCKMYMTRVLVEQLTWFLTKYRIKFSRNDFVAVESFRPFKLRLSNGAQVEVMFCDGNELGNSSVVLVRRFGSPMKEPLLYFYSAVQQTAPERLLQNETFRHWIRNGADLMFLNLCAASKPWFTYNFDKIAESMGQGHSSRVAIELPMFGYEFAIKELSQRLRCQIALCGMIEELYKRTTSINMTYFASSRLEARILFYCKGDAPPQDIDMKMLSLDALEWTPMTTRDNLLLFCSLVRPKKIDGIIMTKRPDVYRAPEHLYQYCAKYHKKVKSNDNTNLPQTQISDTKRSEAYRFVKRRDINYIDDDSSQE